MVGSIALGETAPDFELKDLEGKRHLLSDRRGRIVVLDFWSAECPWSLKSDEALSADESMVRLMSSVDFWRIAPNANERHDDLVRVAKERGLEPILHDPDHHVADLYEAMATPHVFVIDTEGRLCYMGASDNSTWRDPEPTRNYLAEAIEATQKGEALEVVETPARGCSIVRYKVE